MLLHLQLNLEVFLDAAAITANQNVGTNNKSRTDFMSLFDKYGLVFTGFGNDGVSHTAEYTNNTDFPSVAIPNGNDVSDSNFKAWALEVAKAIWLYGHPLYDADAIAFSNALEAIYASDVYPTELGTIINDAALAVEYAGTVGHTPRTDFMEIISLF